MNVWILIVGLKWFSNGSKWPWIVFDACNSYFWYIKILVWVWWRDFFFIGVRFFGCRFWGLKDIVDEHPWPSDGQPRISLGPNPLPRTAPDRGDTLDRVKLRLHSNQFIFTSCLNSSNWSSLTDTLLTVEFFHISSSHLEIVIFYQPLIASNISRSKILRFWIEYKIFSFDFRRLVSQFSSSIWHFSLNKIIQ